MLGLVLAASVVMTCHFDQWRRLPNGTIQYTHMTCKDKKGGESLWMRVPDHSMSWPISNYDLKEQRTLAPELLELPEVHPDSPDLDQDISVAKKPRD